MDASDLLTALRRDGLTLRADGGELVVTPKATLTDAARSLIREHKAELLAELAGPSTTQAITDSAAEHFEERAGIAKYDGGLSREAAEAQAREATERYRLECWERHRQAAEHILSLSTWAAREAALERYRQTKIAEYGEKKGEIMGREMAGSIRFRSGLTN